MSVLLSILLVLSPIWNMSFVSRSLREEVPIPSWNLSLKRYTVEKVFQRELSLPLTVDDKYLILNFDEAKTLSLFKTDCLNLTSQYLAIAELNKRLERKVKTLETLVSQKDIQIKLLERQVVSLRSAVENSNNHEWNIGLILVSAVVVGYIVYDTSR